MANNLVIKTSEIVTIEEISRVFEEDPEIEFVTVVPSNPDKKYGRFKLSKKFVYNPV